MCGVWLSLVFSNHPQSRSAQLLSLSRMRWASNWDEAVGKFSLIRSLAQVCVYTVLIWPHISHKHTRINAQSQIRRVDRGPGGRLIKFEKCQSIINRTDTNSESHNQRFLNQKTRLFGLLKKSFSDYFQSFGHIWVTISVFRSLKHHVESISELLIDSNVSENNLKRTFTVEFCLSSVQLNVSCQHTPWEEELCKNKTQLFSKTDMWGIWMVFV